MPRQGRLITLDDVVELESKVARLGQIHGPIVYIADSDVWAGPWARRHDLPW